MEHRELAWRFFSDGKIPAASRRSRSHSALASVLKFQKTHPDWRISTDKSSILMQEQLTLSVCLESVDLRIDILGGIILQCLVPSVDVIDV